MSILKMLLSSVTLVRVSNLARLALDILKHFSKEGGDSCPLSFLSSCATRLPVLSRDFNITLLPIFIQRKIFKV